MLLGSKPINLSDFPSVKGIFRVGIGKDNVPEKEAFERGVIVHYPDKETIEGILMRQLLYMQPYF